MAACSCFAVRHLLALQRAEEALHNGRKVLGKRGMSEPYGGMR
jgi:hypothetical protein